MTSKNNTVVEAHKKGVGCTFVTSLENVQFDLLIHPICRQAVFEFLNTTQMENHTQHLKSRYFVATFVLNSKKKEYC